MAEPFSIAFLSCVGADDRELTLGIDGGFPKLYADWTVSRSQYRSPSFPLPLCFVGFTRSVNGAALVSCSTNFSLVSGPSNASDHQAVLISCAIVQNLAMLSWTSVPPYIMLFPRSIQERRRDRVPDVGLVRQIQV